MIFDSQTGSQFVDGRTSYLRFKVATNAASTGDFGQGSAMNIFERVLIRSRQGKELTRLEGANLLNLYRDRFSCPKDYFTTNGLCEGHPAGAGAGATVVNEGDGSSDMTAGLVWVLPLHKLPFFDQARLLPPQIMEGLRIEITLAAVDAAFYTSTGTAPTTYTVSEIELKWDVYDVADQFKRAIMEMSAAQGLNLVHKEYYRTIVSASSNQFDFDVKKAASKALQVITIPRISDNVAKDSVDSMKTEPYLYTKQQYHVGGTYWPNAPLETSVFTGAGVNEAYYWTLAAFGSTPCRKPVGTTPLEYAAGHAISSASLNKSQTSDIQGTIINNSRALLASISFSTTVARRLDCYLCHLRAVKVYPSNCIVRD